MSEYQLAQCNISKLKKSLDDKSMQEFTSFLEPVNAWADAAPGFIWRLKTEDGLASSKMPPVFADSLMIINISLWRDIESLSNFTFNTVHAYFMKNRGRWLDKVDKVQFAMWWTPAATVPTVEQAVQKLELLDEIGPTLNAFNWQKKFPAPEST